MRFLLPLVATIALAACSSEKSGTFETEDGTQGEYTVDSDGEGMEATVTTDEGTATMQSGRDVNAELPNGFTLYPGAEVVTTTRFDGPEGKVTAVTMTSDADKDAVTAFYRKQAAAAGIKIEMEMSINGLETIAGKGKDDEAFSLTVTPAEDGGPATLQLSLVTPKGT